MHPDSLFTGTLKSLPCLRRAPGQADDGNTGQGRIPLSLHGERRRREPRNKAEPAMQGLLHPQWREGEFPPTQSGLAAWGDNADGAMSLIFPSVGCTADQGLVVWWENIPIPIPIPISSHSIPSYPAPSHHILSHPHLIPPQSFPSHSIPVVISPHLIPSHLIPHHCTACLPKDVEFSLEGHSKARGPLQALHAPWRAWTSHRCPRVPNIPRKVPDGHKQPRAHS